MTLAAFHFQDEEEDSEPRFRKYEEIWHRIQKAQFKDGLWVTVRVRRKEMIKTVSEMVQQEKAKTNRLRKQLDLPRFTRMEIRYEEDKLQVSFRLRLSGDSI